MGNSNSKQSKGKGKDRIDSFESTYANESVPSTTQDTAVGKRKSSQPTIEIDGKRATLSESSPSPRGKRPSTSSPRASHGSQRSTGSDFLTKNGIKAADAQVTGNANGVHYPQGSPNTSTKPSGNQPTEASSAAQNPYILPGTVGTIDIAGTNYISNGPLNTQVFGTSAGSYTAPSIAHGGL